MPIDSILEHYLPLSEAALHVLLALVEKERHGYSIMQEIENLTNGKMHLGPSTLYRTIRQLLEGGLIEETEERPDPALDDERRRYYRMTSLGEQVIRAELERLLHLVKSPPASRLLGTVGNS